MAEVLEARVDPRVTRTRALIRDAFLSLLPEKGFEHISVLDITERATVNRATFYAHFSDKFALLEETIRSSFRSYLADAEALRSDDVRPLLRAVGQRLLEFVESHRGCRLDKGSEPLFAGSIEAELYALLSDMLDVGSARVASAAMVGVAMQWRTNCGGASLGDVAAKMTDVLVDGVKVK